MLWKSLCTVLKFEFFPVCTNLLRFSSPTSSLTCPGHLQLTLLPEIIPTCDPCSLLRLHRVTYCPESLEMSSTSRKNSLNSEGKRALSGHSHCWFQKNDSEESYLSQCFPKVVLGGTMYIHNKEERGSMVKKYEKS